MIVCWEWDGKFAVHGFYCRETKVISANSHPKIGPQAQVERIDRWTADQVKSVNFWPFLGAIPGPELSFRLKWSLFARCEGRSNAGQGFATGFSSTSNVATSRKGFAVVTRFIVRCTKEKVWWKRVTVRLFGGICNWPSCILLVTKTLEISTYSTCFAKGNSLEIWPFGVSRLNGTKSNVSVRHEKIHKRKGGTLVQSHPSFSWFDELLLFFELWYAKSSPGLVEILGLCLTLQD